ncbi:hypothetical protein BKA62DRAFT_78424 [Auriculariales sp. MPI-PUGE-AT-0066]|nr:hypothetical protein BKA62DRAFT_78424 [Auriculariales sp. MPI-PUGE-AT-0066]
MDMDEDEGLGSDSEGNRDLVQLAQELRAYRTIFEKGRENGRPSASHDEHDLNILHAVRVVTADVLGITRSYSANSTVHYSGFSDPPEAAQLDQADPATLSKDNIFVAWNVSMSHPINRAAAQIIADEVISHPDYIKLFKDRGLATQHGIAIAVQNHLRYLARVYENIGFALSQFTDEQKHSLQVTELLRKWNNAANQRRRRLHRWRIDTAIYFGYEDWVDLLKHARADSMSSDDPASGNERRARSEHVYYVTIKDWRHPDFIQFLRILDLCGRERELRTKSFGRWLRTRLAAPTDAGLRKSSRRATPKLVPELYSEKVAQGLGTRHRFPKVQVISLRDALIDVTALAISLQVEIPDGY